MEIIDVTSARDEDHAHAHVPPVHRTYQRVVAALRVLLVEEFFVEQPAWCFVRFEG